MRRIVVVFTLVACQADLRLSETEQGLTSVTPSSTDFGALQVGTTSSARVFAINPTGYSSQTVTAVTHSCPDFSVSAPNLPADVYRICNNLAGVGTEACTEPESQSYFFSTTFHPIVGGATSCLVTIEISSGNKTVTLNGTGTIPPVDISISPGNVNFGDVRRNTSSSPASLMVRNNGGSVMTVVSATTSAGFTITAGPGSTTIGAGGQQPYTLICQPTGLGPMAGVFRVLSDDPDSSIVDIPLACNGIDSNLDISPSPAQLPMTRVGEPAETTIQLTNSGAASMMVTSVALDGAGLELVVAPDVGTVLAAGASTPVRVRFGATAPATAAGTLTVVYDGANTRTAQITARALATSMALTPGGDVDLGPICLGQSKVQPFSVLANAEGAFKLLGITQPAAPFALTGPALPADVAGSGGTSSFEIRAQPTATGSLASSVVVTTDIPGSEPRTIGLSAVALDAGVSGTPAVLDLGEQALDVTTIGQEVAVTNCTTSAVTLANARIEGLDAASFAIVQAPAPGALAPSGIARWLVVFTPRSAGRKTATFLVDHEGGTSTVELSGDGLGPVEVGGPKGYYACSTGDAGALGPLALVLALLGWPRRRQGRAGRTRTAGAARSCSRSRASARPTR